MVNFDHLTTVNIERKPSLDN